MNSSKNTFEAEKQRIVQWVLGLSEPKLLERVKYLMASQSEVDWWDEITEPEKLAINEGLAQIKAGQGIPHDEVKRGYAKWL
jgi:hypothetical protein